MERLPRRRPDATARSRRLARLTDLPGARGWTGRRLLSLRAWDALVRGEPVATVLAHADRALAGPRARTRSPPDPRTGASPAAASRCPSCSASPTSTATGRTSPRRYSAKPPPSSRAGRARLPARVRDGAARPRPPPHRATGRGRGTRPRGAAARRPGGHGQPAGCSGVGILLRILIARGRIDEARRTAEAYGYGAAAPAVLVHPDPRPYAANYCSPAACTARRPRNSPPPGRGWTARRAQPAWCPGSSTWPGRWPGRPARAADLARDAVARARRFGTASGTGRALLAAARTATRADRPRLLDEAVTLLERSPAAHDLALALVDHGTALRHAGRPARRPTGSAPGWPPPSGAGRRPGGPRPRRTGRALAGRVPPAPRRPPAPHRP
ncbi:hypothetical protein NKH77_10260 [Streptomyces sp. M19]